MNKISYRIFATVIFTCSLCMAQADDSQPAVTNVRGSGYPRIHSDLRVVFQFKAPGAQKVQLQPGGDDNGLGKGPIEMARGADGTWSVTVSANPETAPLTVVARRAAVFSERSRDR